LGLGRFGQIPDVGHARRVVDVVEDVLDLGIRGLDPQRGLLVTPLAFRMRSPAFFSPRSINTSGFLARRSN
jgi:hypothetical protein